MNDSSSDAKARAKATMTGIWAAALMPFTDDLRIDEDGFRARALYGLYVALLGVATKRARPSIEAELSKLKRMYADLSMENDALKDLIEKKL